MIKKILLFALALFVVIYLGICVLVYFKQTSLMFFPSKNIPTFDKPANLSEITIVSSDNVKLNAWYLDNQSDKTVIFCHGNGGNMYSNYDRLSLLNELRVNAIMFDYRGYGKSEGEIIKELDLYSDAKAVYEYVINRGALPEDIIIWGQSLGGAVAVDLAQNKNVQAVIIESSFYSMDDMAQANYGFLPVKLLSKFHFRSDEKIVNISSPILIIYSRADEVINYNNSLKLYEIIKGPKRILEVYGSHGGSLTQSYDQYIKVLREFLNFK